MMMNVFFIAVGIGSLAVLGVGQVFYEPGEMQKIADTAALEAARQISDGPNFDSALSLAQENGLSDDMELTLTCLVNGQASPDNCSGATTVRAEVSETFLPFFFLEDAEVRVVAEAQLAPLINGQVGSGLLSISTQQSELLNGLFSGLGLGSVSLTALGWDGLVNSSIQIPLVDLGLELNAVSLENLATLDVNALSLLNAAFAVARTNDPTELPSVPADLANVLNNVDLNLEDVLVLDLSESTQGVVDIGLGQLIRATLLGSLAAVTNDPESGSTSAINLPISLSTLGVNLSVQLLEPPKVFVGRKVEGKSPIVTTETAQARIIATVNGLPPTNLGIPGLASVTISGLNLKLLATSSGGTLSVDAIDCRIPRTDNTVDLTVTPSLVQVCLSGTDGTCLSGGSNVLSLSVIGPLGIPTLNSSVRARLNLAASSTPSNVRLFGLMPQSIMVPTGLGDSLSNTLENLDLQLSVTGNTSAIATFLPSILNNTASVLAPVLGQTGSLLDETFEVLGVGLNNVEVDVNSVDCKSSILTL